MQPNGGKLQRTVWLDRQYNAILLLRKSNEENCMKTRNILMGFSIALIFSAAFGDNAKVPSNSPQYAADGQLQLPEQYREWVYLSTGFDMSYNPAMRMGHHMFDNVFVNPESYKAFLATGTWPDKTVLVLEVRGAEDKGSINKAGNFQSVDTMGVEVHMKDEARFPGKWAFFGFGTQKTAKMIPTSADCYSCHAEHTAVDTTFVQFYPTLLPIAKSKNTLSAGYLKDLAAEKK
jgi:hypothetical protein